jgi:hypothetical protein
MDGLVFDLLPFLKTQKMKYAEEFTRLKAIENFTDDSIELNDKLVLRNFDFTSRYSKILPGGTENNDKYEYIPHDPEDYEPDVICAMLKKNDAEIDENIHFRYHVIMPKGEQRSKHIILMFHGFNEKYWDKYLPWVEYICEHTGKSIVMFPIAFHMNRAPLAWSDSHGMYNVSQQRKQRHPEVLCSSLSNVAISTRLHNKPQRFIWSGLQTYYDVVDFVESVKAGKHPAIDADATIDFFSYSIGTLLGEILMMTDKNGYFSHSRYATFCGGPVFNRLSPVSKFILDSEADVSLYSYVVEHLESHMRLTPVLSHFMGDLPEGINFRCMLNYKTLTQYREQKFRAMSDRFYAIALVHDEVVPPYEVVNTLQGAQRDIPIPVDVFDFPFKYTHENPFPVSTKFDEQVTEQFLFVFNKVCDFLK